MIPRLVLAGILVTTARSLAADPLTLRTQADAAFTANSFSDAAQLYTDLTTANPTHGHAFARLADCHLALNNPDAAIPPLTRALELGAILRPDALYQLARCHALAGRPDAALDHLTQSLAAGYRFRPRIASDKAFSSLSDNPRFQDLAGRTPLPPDLSRDAGYAHDLAYLTAEVQRLHFLYRRQPLPPAYTDLAASIQSRLPTLTDEQITVELQRLLATLGDGHTLLLPFDMKRGQLPRLPLTLYLFSDGLFITGAPDPGLVGAKITHLAGLPPDQLLINLEPYLSRDNPQGLLWTGPVYLTFPHFLQAAGANIPDPTTISLTLTRDGKSRDLTLPAAAPVDPDTISIKLTPPKGPATRPTTFRPDTHYFFTDLNDRTTYVQFNQIQNAKDESLSAFALRLRKHLDDQHTQTLILDLRQNNGGEGSLLPDLEHALIHFETTRAGSRLYVLIGRGTFSAAQQLASFCSHHTSAIFVGEPTGSRPNRPGDESPVILPYTGLRASVASGYHQAAPKDDRLWIPPDLPVPLTSKDYLSNHDPALDAILSRLPHPQH